MSSNPCCGLWEKWQRYYGTNSWLKISMMLCAFGFLKEFRPSEPFIYEFLVGPWRNITDEQIQQEVYPVGTYSYLAHLLIVFLVTDICRYKALIILLALSGVAVWSMLIFTKSLLWLQIIEVVYGTFMSTEIAYYTYIYAKVDKDYYQEVSSHTRAAILASRALSGITAQVLISFNVMDYKQLNYITLGSLVCALCWAPFLPAVKRTIYFHQKSNQRILSPSRYSNAYVLMKSHFVESFRQRYVLKWSLWWALTTAGFIQIQTYVQPLWSEIQQDEPNPIFYNGAVEAAATIVGFLGALLGGYLRVDWQQKGELILSICAISSASVTLISSQAENVFISYVCYASFVALYHFVITIASAEIAKHIVEDSYGLVFGLNTFLALVLQTCLTMAFVTKDFGFAMAPRNQFLSYGIYHIGIAAIFIVIGLISWIKSSRDLKKTYS